MIEKIKSIVRSIFLETSPLHDQRVNICHACKFHDLMHIPGLNSKHMTCGKPITGETIVYEGKDVELCGCVIEQKAKDPDAVCPIGFWEVLDDSKKSIKKDGV